MNQIIYLKFEDVETFAWVTEISTRHHKMFKVLFKNGYENIFFTDVETGYWMEEDLGFTQLAKEVGQQVKAFMKTSVPVPKILTWHKEITDDGIISFGFFNFRKDQYKMFEIFNNSKKYLYTLVEMENETWQILGNNSLELKNIDPVFIENVIRILPLYWMKAR